MFFDQEKILEHVDLLTQAVKDKYPDSRIYVILIGASSLLVKDSLDKHTQHSYSMKTKMNKPFGIGGMLQDLGFHVVSEALMDFHPDYIDRLENISDKESIHSGGISFSLSNRFLRSRSNPALCHENRRQSLPRALDRKASFADGRSGSG